MRSLVIAFLLASVSVSLFNCSPRSEELLDIQEYTGPIGEVLNATIFYSDSAKVKMRMNTPKLYNYGNGDSEYPEGLFMEFFDNEGNLTSSLEADYCYYTKKVDLYKATGNVVIKNLEKGDRLDTEELFWNKKKEEVFTDKFVRIEKDGDLHLGDGLKAKQDFSSYSLLNPHGKLSLSNQDN